MTKKRFSHLVSCLTTSGLLLAGLFLLMGASAKIARANPGDLFVTPGGSGDCSAASPCDLQTALVAAADGDSIYMAQGTYTNSGGAVVTLTRSLSLYGGWDGSAATPPALDPQAYLTTINGEAARRGVFVGSGITVTLQGLAITNGMHNFQGAGLYAQGADLTLRAVTVYSNVIDVFDVADTYAYGGGAMVEGGKLVVEDSTFQANSAWARISSYGGGLAITGDVSAALTNTLFIDNDAWDASGLFFRGTPGNRLPFDMRNSTFVGNGLGNSAGRASGGYVGALEVANADAWLEGNTISNNAAANDYGAVGVFSSQFFMAGSTITGNRCARTSGLYLSSADFNIFNSVIAGNRSVYNWLADNPAVMMRYSQGDFTHTTIAGNDSDYGVYLSNGSAVELTNTILLSHTVGISVTAGSTATLEATLWGSGDWANDTDWGGAGSILTGTINLWGNPAFAYPSLGNYHIGADSAARDAGVDAGVLMDIDWQVRPIGAGFDIGADEFVPRLYLPMLLRR